MDSAKNKKSFLDFSDEPSPALEVADGFAAFGKPKGTHFSLSSTMWEGIQRDPVVKAEFDRRVEEQVRSRIEKDSSAERQAMFQDAEAKGREAGLSAGKAEIAVRCQELERIGQQLIHEKAEMLHAHEKIWCEAVHHLMRRFLVPLTVEKLSGLQAWLEQAIGDLEKQARIRVQLSPSLYAQVSQSAQETPHWEWVEDKDLSDSQLRAEIPGGGIFFSPENEWLKFEEKMADILGANPK